MAVIGRRVRQTLDFAHDVVADVTDHAALQRWQLLNNRRRISSQHRLECDKKPAVCRNTRRHGTTRAHLAVDERKLGARATPNETEASPALAMFDRLEQEARLVTHQGEKCANRCVLVRDHLAPHRHRAVCRCQRAELFATRRDAHATAYRYRPVLASMREAATACRSRSRNMM